MPGARCFPGANPVGPFPARLTWGQGHGAEPNKDDVLFFFDGKIAKWWTPDDVVFVDAIPLGATGKMLKHQLRERYENHLLART